jgi:hypothetical protein
MAFAASHWSGLTLACVFLVLLFVSIRSMPLPSVACAQDVGLFLDAGWRFYQDLKCHSDYHSPLGPLFGMLPGIFFKLFGPDYLSLKLLPFSVSLIFTVWVYLLTRESMVRAVSLLGSVAIGLFAGGLFHPGFDYHALTFATFYNRVSYGLLSIAAIAALLPRSDISSMKAAALDASLGASLSAMLFLKVNFFAAGMLFLVGSFLLFRRSQIEWLWLCVSAASVCAAFTAAIGFRLDLMAADLALALASREGSTSSLFFFPARNFLANADYFAVVAALVLTTVLAAAQDWSQRGIAWRALFSILLATTVGFGLTLMQSHGDGRSFPTMVAGAMTACAWTSVESFHTINTRRMIAAAASLLAIMVGWPHFAAYHFLYGLQNQQFAGEFSSKPLASWRVSAFNSWGEDFIPMVNEAAQLVRQHARPDASLQYIDMANVFCFALGMRSPKKSMLWWDDRSTYSRRAHPDKSVFEDTDFILLPVSRPIQPQPVWTEIYGPYVAENYVEAGRSSNFLLMGKKSER